MSIETLDYTIIFNGHTVTCFEVGSIPTIGYASIEDAMTGTNPVIVPECIFEAACALLDQGVHLTAIYAHVGEETWMQWDEIPEKLTAEDIVAIEGEESIRKQAVNRKQRRARRIDHNKSRKGSDRAHGKRHGKKYLDNLPRKKYLEADNYDHPTFKIEKGKLRLIKDVKRARETAKVRDALDISPVERLTASVLAHMSNHVFMWDEQLVYDLTEALCKEYRQPFPDDSYICVYGKHVYLYMQYMDGNGILQDEQRYTLR